MTFEVEFTNAAQKSLEKLDAEQQRRIAGAIELLRINPRPPAAIMLRGGLKGLWRVRVGDHRIVYTIKDEQLIVLVLRIGHRRDVYER